MNVPLTVVAVAALLLGAIAGAFVPAQPAAQPQASISACYWSASNIAFFDPARGEAAYTCAACSWESRGDRLQACVLRSCGLTVEMLDPCGYTAYGINASMFPRR